MRVCRNCFALTSCCLLLGGSIWAEEAAMPAVEAAAEAVKPQVVSPAKTAPPERVLRLGEIVVQASALKRDLLEKPTLEAESLSIAISTVEAEDIRRQDASTLAEAMEYSPGVFTETRGRKEKTLSSFRGQIYPYPDFALNGVWQRAFWELPSFFPAAAIDRVEILRSGGAIMVGPNSGLVGAINIVPRRFDEPTTIFDMQGGSHKTTRGSVVHGDRLANGYYTVGASNYSTAGKEGANAAERSNSVFGTIGYAPAENLDLELTLFFMRGSRELRLSEPPGALNLRTQYEEYDPYTAFGGIGRALLKHSEKASTEFDLGFVKRDAKYIRHLPVRRTNGDDDVEYNGGIIHAHNLGENNTIRFGLQYNHWVCPKGKRDFVGSRRDVETGSIVVMDEHRFARLTLDAGVRVTRTWYRDYNDNSFNIVGNNMSGRYIGDDWGDPVVIGTLGAKYQLTKPLALYAHLAAGDIEAPPGAQTNTGASLASEQRLILDGGVSFDNAKYGSAKLGAFAIMRENASLLATTTVTVAGETFNTYTNNDVRQYGLELECRSAKIFDTVTLFGTATVLTAERDLGGSWTRYREIPQTICSAGVYLDFDRLEFNIFGKYVSHYENRRFSQGGVYNDLGDFFNLNLNARYTLGRNRSTSVYCSLKNVLDDEYSTVVGYPDYGFQAFIGLEHKL